MKKQSVYHCENCNETFDGKEIILERDIPHCPHCGGPVQRDEARADHEGKPEARTAIYKYPLPMEEDPEICLPAGSQILTVQTQNNAPYVWALIETDAPLTTRRFCLRGTGHTFKGNEGKYIGTFQLGGGELVFHLFEEGRK
jgi:DNA-directed RNA polymerase subunit RPC12/RpoP